MLPRPSHPAMLRFRNWLRSDMLVLRWVLLGLYLLVVLGLSVLMLKEDGDLVGIWLVLFGSIVVSQCLFIFGAGTIHLCHPVRKGRLWMPVLAASFMLGVLGFGLAVAMFELFNLDQVQSPLELFVIVGFWGFVLFNWIFWGVLMWRYARPWPRMKVLGRLAAIVFAGSLAELLACVPSHVITSRRPQCLAGLGTMLGIIAGLNVMFFAFGPMIVVLFLRPRYHREIMESRGERPCLNCGYDLRGTTAAGRTACPECGEAVDVKR